MTLKLLEDMGIRYFVIGKDTTEEEVSAAMQEFRKELDRGEDVAFVIRKGALSYEEKVEYRNDNPMIREEIIRHIVQASGEDPIVSTTGKASRELFEIREHNGQSHKYDFLTVGSMGHSSSIALGVAVQKPGTKVWCVDGDGAVLMHMGSMAVLGSTAPENMVHIVINNGAHETVGGMPTVAADMDLVSIAKACGYLRGTGQGTDRCKRERDPDLYRSKMWYRSKGRSRKTHHHGTGEQAELHGIPEGMPMTGNTRGISCTFCYNKMRKK